MKRFRAASPLYYLPRGSLLACSLARLLACLLRLDANTTPASPPPRPPLDRHAASPPRRNAPHRNTPREAPARARSTRTTGCSAGGHSAHGRRGTLNGTEHIPKFTPSRETPLPLETHWRRPRARGATNVTGALRCRRRRFANAHRFCTTARYRTDLRLDAPAVGCGM